MNALKSSAGSVRIIGGQWRRRRIQFDAVEQLRPTTDSARETLFNWLQTSVQGSICLDLFAGSGALGFEALSRGAQEVVLVDSHSRCVRNLRRNADILNAVRVEIVHQDARKYLNECVRRFDIVFIDPPFYRSLVDKVMQQLATSECLNRGAKVYVEMEKGADPSWPPDDWEVVRFFKTSARVHYLLRQSDSPIVHLNEELVSDC